MAPDQTLVIRRNGAVVGGCSCWWRGTPHYLGARTGFIGGYMAEDDEAGVEVLSAACRTLSQAGCATAIGPVDGSTWHSYRLIVERGCEPAFFLEPQSHDRWAGQWWARGFSPLATYTSAIVDRLDVEPLSLARAERRLARSGIVIRSIDLARADEELHKLFVLSTTSFSRNFLYSPIRFEEFRQQYAALLSAVQPELVLLAERGSDLIGFALALPDVLQRDRTGSIDTVILKTVAVHPSLSGLGLGGVLVACVHRRAQAMGFRRAIHALMHDENRSRGISDRFARPFRRYAVFAKALERGAR